jgi:hypothetical protein
VPDSPAKPPDIADDLAAGLLGDHPDDGCDVVDMDPRPPPRQPGDDSDVVEEPVGDEWIRRAISDAVQDRDLPEAGRLLGELRRRTSSADVIPSEGVDEIFAPLPPLEWVVRDLEIAPGAVTLMAGYGYAGKTAAIQSLEIELASGLPIWGKFEVEAPMPIVHVDYEQGKRLTYERWQRLGRALGVDVDKLRDGHPRHMMRAVTFPEARLKDELRTAWCKLCEDRKLMVVDSYRAAAPHVDENDSKARLPLDMLSGISEDTGCTIAVLLHMRKSQADNPGGTKEAIRGSSGIFDAAQSVLALVGSKGHPTMVHSEKARITGRQLDSFALEIVDVPQGEDPYWGLLVQVCEIEDIEARKAEQRRAKLDRAVLGYVRGNPGCSSKEARAEVTGRANLIDASLQRLARAGKINNLTAGQRGVEHDWRPL